MTETAVQLPAEPRAPVPQLPNFVRCVGVNGDVVHIATAQLVMIVEDANYNTYVMTSGHNQIEARIKALDQYNFALMSSMPDEGERTDRELMRVAEAKSKLRVMLATITAGQRDDRHR